LATSTRVVFKKDEEFGCSICNAISNSLYSLKKHLFDTHTDVEAKARYNRGVPDLVGPFHIKRMRSIMLGVLGQGRFERYIAGLLNPSAPLTLMGLERLYHIKMDPDDANRDRRMALYSRKREVLLNFAETRTGKPLLAFHERMASKFDHESQLVIFDLRKNFREELLPDHLANMVHHTDLAQR
jgi:hypothetical protein